MNKFQYKNSKAHEYTSQYKNKLVLLLCNDVILKLFNHLTNESCPTALTPNALLKNKLAHFDFITKRSKPSTK